MENNTLTHWGIKGMRWGVRRYQNADGSLTSAGKKRQAKNLAKAREAAAKKREERKRLAEEQRVHEEEKAKALKSGTASEILKYRGELTKQEMDAAWSRVQWEQNMKSAAANEAKERGEKFFKNVENITGYAQTAAKAWNMIANVHNALNTDTMLPKFDTNVTNGNRNERKAEKKEKQKAAEAQKKREEQEAQRETKQKERAEKRAAEEAKKSKVDDSDEPLRGTVEGEGTSKGSHKDWKSSKYKDKDIIDVEFVDDTPTSSYRNSEVLSIGQNYYNQFLLEDKS